MSEKEELTVEQKRALFEVYEEAKVNLALASQALDNSVKAIITHIGAGPFRWQNKELSVAKRGDRFLMRVKCQSVEEVG